jgi:hypothetical protein
MRAADGKTTTPLNVFGAAIADVNRQDPSRSDLLDAADLLGVFTQLRELLVDRESGLEQLYAIVRRATASAGP